VPAIIRDLPFSDRETTLDVQGQTVRIFGQQIVVWVSIAEAGRDTFDPGTPRIPAILDTGCNHAFVIQEEQLVKWAGLHPKYLPKLARPARIHGESLPQFVAKVWLHRNQPNSRDEALDRAAFPLECTPGIVVVPKAKNLPPRLPLLGNRALRSAQLRLVVDYRRCRVHLETARRFWLFS